MNPTVARDFIHRRPFVFSALVIAAVTAVDVLLIAIRDLLSVDLAVISTGIISGAVLSLLGVLVITRLGVWRELGFVRSPARPRTLLWFLPFAIYGLLPLTQGLDISAGRTAAAVAFGVLIATWKLIALALVLYAWLPRGPRTAAALTAAVWATMHLGGILVGASVAPTLMLCLSYLFLSYAFVCVWLRTELLWPLVATYALFLTSAIAVQHTDASNLADSVTNLIPAVATSVLLAAYGLAISPRRARPASAHARTRSAAGTVAT